MNAKPVIRGGIQTIIIVPYDPSAPRTTPIAEVVLRGRVRLRRRVVDFTYNLHLMHAGSSAYERALNLGDAESWVSVQEYRLLGSYLAHWIEQYLDTYDWPSNQWLATHIFALYGEIRGAYASMQAHEFVVAAAAD